MPLILSIDAFVVAVLALVVLTKGVESALPWFVFIVVVIPGASLIPLPGLFGLTTQRIATVTLLVLYLAFGKRNSGEQHLQSTPLKYLILLIFGWNLISTLNSVVFTNSLKEVLSNAIDFYLVYYIFVKNVTSKDTVHKILEYFVAALVVCCVFGWLQVYAHWNINNLFPAVAHRFTAGENGLLPSDGRPRSVFPHSILFGDGLALGIPWALYLLAGAKTLLRKTYLWTAVMLMFWDIYKTMSRGAWLGLIISAVILLMFGQMRVRKYLAVIALLAISVCFIRPGVWTTLKNTYFETNNPDSARGSSYQYRYQLMHEGRKALASSFSRTVWGFGPGSFYYLGLKGIDPATGHVEKFQSCDSAFVEIMVGTGYVGLFLVIILLLIPAWVSLRGFGKLPKPANSLSLVFFVSLASYAFMMISVQNWGWGQQTYMLWTILAIAMTYPRLVKEQDTAEARAVERPTEEPAYWLMPANATGH